MESSTWPGAEREEQPTTHRNAGIASSNARTLGIALRSRTAKCLESRERARGLSTTEGSPRCRDVRAALRPRAGGSLRTLAEVGDPRGPFLVPLILLLATRGVAWASIPLPAEDAFITYRYALNLALGHGLVYNPGERVMGFTSPAW